MSFTVPTSGFAVIILILIVLFLDLELLFLATLAFIPFSAMAIINLKALDHWTAITPPLALSALSVIKFALIRREELTEKLLRFKPLGLLAATSTSAIIVSWIGPLAHLHSTQECMQLPNHDVFCPGSFGFRNVVQYGYYILWIIFAWAFAAETCSTERLRRAMNTLLVASSFVVLWSFIQVVVFYVDLPYPSQFFNTSLSAYAQGFTGTYGDINFKRTSSVSVEPSIYAQYLIFVLPLFLSPRLSYETKSAYILRYAGAFCAVASLAASGTRTAFLGWLILIGFYIVAFLITHIRSHLSAIGLLCGGVAAYAMINPNFIKFVNAFLLPIFTSLFVKVETSAIIQNDYSAFERGLSMREAFNVWLKAPVTGVGWRNVTSHDLVLNLLANTGMIGCLLILGTLIFLVIQLTRMAWRTKRENSNMAALFQAFTLSTVTLLLIQQITGFSFVYGSFWMSLSFAFVILRAKEIECAS